MPDIIIDQPECRECGGACCQPERLEFPVPEWVELSTAQIELDRLGLYEARPIQVRVNEHERTVVRTDCPRRWNGCNELARPEPCLRFPLSYLDDDHTDAERAEVAKFCPLFQRLRGEVET